MHSPSDMTGKVALITGASGGLGRATALCLAAAGADLALIDIAAAPLTRVADEARALGAKVYELATDLSLADNCTAAVTAAQAHFGRLDALCNVAGAMLQSETTTMAAADLHRLLAINLAAPFLLTQAALPFLLESAGAVVNVASATADYAAPFLAAYGASKAGLIYMTKAMAMEYMDRPIRINAVAPGAMMTGMIAGLTELNQTNPAIRQRNTPMRGLVDVNDVAQAIAFLASPAAKGYHGACLTIDNGMSL